MAESSRPPPSLAKSTDATAAETDAGDAHDAGSALPFEQALARLETIVDRLEGGDLVLEEALARFEEGVRLSRRLAEQLGAAEQRVDQLLREGGELLVRSFEPAEPEER
jgi:exodeoxyribonuclease VII small subunit